MLNENKESCCPFCGTVMIITALPFRPPSIHPSVALAPIYRVTIECKKCDYDFLGDNEDPNYILDSFNKLKKDTGPSNLAPVVDKLRAALFESANSARRFKGSITKERKKVKRAKEKHKIEKAYIKQLYQNYAIKQIGIHIGLGAAGGFLLACALYAVATFAI